MNCKCSYFLFIKHSSNIFGSCSSLVKDLSHKKCKAQYGVASQEEAISTGKARRTPGSCHHSQSPLDVSVHSRKTCFLCTASTFKPWIDSHHGGTWDSPVGKPRGKASWESLVGKPRAKATDPLIHAKGSVTPLL